MPSLTDLLNRITSAEAELHRATAALDDSVADARAAGATWQQVGDAIGISKQAAAQRFTPHSDAEDAVPSHIEEDLGVITRDFFNAWARNDTDAMYAHMTYTTGRLLPRRKMARVWQTVLEACGPYRSLKRLVVERYHRDYLVTFRLDHGNGEPVGQIMFNTKLKMTGMMIFNDDSAELPW